MSAADDAVSDVAESATVPDVAESATVTAELRTLVRELLASEVAAAGRPAPLYAQLGPEGAVPPAAPVPTRPVAGEPDWAAPPGAAPSTPASELVARVDSDADLHALVVRVLDLAADPQQAQALRSGRLPVRLERGPQPVRPGPARGAAPRAAASGAAAAGPVHRVERGAVTESVVRRAAAAGQRLVLGRRAVLTPLARDRARSLGLVVERVDLERGR